MFSSRISSCSSFDKGSYEFMYVSVHASTHVYVHVSLTQKKYGQIFFLSITECFHHFHTYRTNKHHTKLCKTRQCKGIAYEMKYDVVDSPYSMRNEFCSNYQMAELNTENPYVWLQQGTSIDIHAFQAKCLSRCRVLHSNITIWL